MSKHYETCNSAAVATQTSWMVDSFLQVWLLICNFLRNFPIQLSEIDLLVRLSWTSKFFKTLVSMAIVMHTNVTNYTKRNFRFDSHNFFFTFFCVKIELHYFYQFWEYFYLFLRKISTPKVNNIDTATKRSVKIFDRRKRSDSFNVNALGTDKIVLHGRTTVTSNQVKFIIFTTSRYTCQFYVLCANNNGRRLVIIIHHRIALMRFKGEI